MNSMHSLEVRRKCLEHDGKVLFLFSEDDSELEGLAGISGCIYEHSIDVPMNVKAGIALDKFLGRR